MLELMIINLCCSTAMALCGWWVLTDRSMPMLVRLFCALIATGGSVVFCISAKMGGQSTHETPGSSLDASHQCLTPGCS